LLARGELRPFQSLFRKREEKAMECDHIWQPTNASENGDLDFRLNRQMSPEPMAHVGCDGCNARTWMTVEQWDALEKDPEF